MVAMEGIGERRVEWVGDDVAWYYKTQSLAASSLVVHLSYGPLIGDETAVA
jgi:hypothetical protein